MDINSLAELRSRGIYLFPGVGQVLLQCATFRTPDPTKAQRDSSYFGKVILFREKFAVLDEMWCCPFNPMHLQHRSVRQKGGARR